MCCALGVVSTGWETEAPSRLGDMLLRIRMVMEWVAGVPLYEDHRSTARMRQFLTSMA
jgi:hypothetical protein